MSNRYGIQCEPVCSANFSFPEGHVDTWQHVVVRAAASSTSSMRTAIAMSGTRPVSRRMCQRSDPAAVAVQAGQHDGHGELVVDAKQGRYPGPGQPARRAGVTPAMISATTCG